MAGDAAPVVAHPHNQVDGVAHLRRNAADRLCADLAQAFMRADAAAEVGEKITREVLLRCRVAVQEALAFQARCDAESGGARDLQVRHQVGQRDPAALLGHHVAQQLGRAVYGLCAGRICRLRAGLVRAGARALAFRLRLSCLCSHADHSID